MWYESVRQFHEKQSLGINVPWTPKLELLRRHLILEELGEATLAHYRRDKNLFFDGMGDLTYVVVGTAVQFGYKPPEEYGVSVWQRLPNWDEDCFLQLHKELMGELMGFVGDREVQSMVFCIVVYAQQVGLPLKEIFDRVQRANMTKSVRQTDERVSNKGASFIPPTYDDLAWGA